MLFWGPLGKHYLTIIPSFSFICFAHTGWPGYGWRIYGNSFWPGASLAPSAQIPAHHDGDVALTHLDGVVEKAKAKTKNKD